MLYPLLLAAWCATGMASMHLQTGDVWLLDPTLSRRGFYDSGLQARGLGFLYRDPRRGASPMQRAQNIPSNVGGDTRPSSPSGTRSGSATPPQQRPQLQGQQSGSHSPPSPPPPPPPYPRPGNSQGPSTLTRQMSRQQSVEYEEGQLPSNHHKGANTPARTRSEDAGIRQLRENSPNRPVPGRASRSEDNPAPRARVQSTMLGRESLHSQLRYPREGLSQADIIGAIRGPAKIRAAGARGPAEHWRLQPGESALIGPSDTPTTSVKARILPHREAKGEVALVANAHKEANVVVTTDNGGSGSVHFKKPEHLAYSRRLESSQTGTASGEVMQPPGNVIVAGDLRGPGKIEAKAEDFRGTGGMRRNSGTYFHQNQ